MALLVFLEMAAATIVVLGFVPPATPPVTRSTTTELHAVNVDRRFFMRAATIVASQTLISRSEAAPVESSRRPYAPTAALLPAIRVRLTVDRALALADRILVDPSGSAAALAELEDLILTPQNYVKSFKTQGVPDRPSAQYLESYKPMKGDLPFQRILIETGTVGTWKNLKRAEKARERDNEILAALNAYTDALTFSPDTILLNVDARTRSEMIREERLPDVTNVVTSDMGLRGLYRNQVLTAMDDVRAELRYQKGRDGVIDPTELVGLLRETRAALDQWFGLIDPGDVREALAEVGT